MDRQETQSLEGYSSGEVVRAVRDMYARHPFPPAQHKRSYRQQTAYVREFLAERAVPPLLSEIR